MAQDAWEQLEQAQRAYGEAVRGGLAPTETPVEAEPVTPVAPKVEQVGPTVEPIEGPAGPEHFMFDPKTAKKALRYAEDMPVSDVAMVHAVQAMHPGVSTGTVEELEQVAMPEWYETIYTLFGPFDWPRSYAWTAAYGAASLLPDATRPDEEPTFVSRTGDKLRHITGQYIAPAVFDAAMGDIAFSDVWSNIVGSDKVDESPIKEIGKNLYDAMATGALYDKATGRRSFVRWGEGEGGGIPFIDVIGPEGFDTPMPLGVDLIDAAVPKELAERLATETVHPAKKLLWSALSTDLGREAYGLAAEVVVDPLWFAGPAKGGKMIHDAGTGYRIGRQMVKAMSSVKSMTGTSDEVVNKAVIKLFTGTDEEVDASRKLFDVAQQTSADEAAKLAAHADELRNSAKAPEAAKIRAIREAERARDRVEELRQLYGADASAVRQLKVAEEALERAQKQLGILQTDSQGAAAYLLKQAARHEKNAQFYSQRAEVIRRAMNMADKGRRGGVFDEAGRFAVHVPFGHSTHYLAKTGTAKKIRNVLPEPLIQRLEYVKDLTKPLSAEAIATKLNKAAQEGVPFAQNASVAEQYALAFHKVVGKASTIPLQAWDLFARAFGTRWIQPMLASVEADATIARHAATGPGNMFLRMSSLSGKMMTMKHVSPEIWENYQKAVGDFMRNVEVMQDDLVLRTERLMREAKTAHEIRKRVATKKAIATEDARHGQLLREHYRAADGPEKALKKKEMLASRNRLSQLRRWASDEYSPVDVIFEAGDHWESGAGTLKARPELMPAVEEVEALVNEAAERLGEPVEKIRQALAQMSRFLSGDPMIHDELQLDLANVVQGLRDVGVREAYKREQISTLAGIRRTQVNAYRRILGRLSPEVLAGTLEEVNVRLAGQAYDDAVYSQSLRDLIYETTVDPRIADQVIRDLMIAFDTTDGAEALAILTKMVFGTTRRGEAPAGRIVANKIREIAGQLDEELENLGRIARGEFDVVEEAEMLSNILGSRAARDLAKIRANIGDDGWDAFQALALRMRGADMETMQTEAKLLAKQLAEAAEAKTIKANAPTKFTVEALDDAADVTLEEFKKGAVTGRNIKDIGATTELGREHRFADKGEKASMTDVGRWGASNASDGLLVALKQGEKNGMPTQFAVVRRQPGQRNMYFPFAYMKIDEDGVIQAITFRPEIGLDPRRKARFARAMLLEAERVLEENGKRLTLRGADEISETTAEMFHRHSLIKKMRRGEPIHDDVARAYDDLIIENRAIFAPAHAPARLTIVKALRTDQQIAAVVETAVALRHGVRKAVREGMDLSGIASGAHLGEFKRDNLIRRRLIDSIKGAATEEEAVTRVRAALDIILPTDFDPLLANMADAYAARIGPTLFHQPRLSGQRAQLAADVAAEEASIAVRGTTPSVQTVSADDPIQALTGARLEARQYLDEEMRHVNEAERAAKREVKEQHKVWRDELRGHRKTLEAAIKDVEPKLQVPEGIILPDGAVKNRVLERWEMDLWKDFVSLPHVQQLPDEDRLLAAFSALRNSPELPQELGKFYDDWLKEYPVLMGRRLGEVPPELEPVILELRSIIASYEQLYLEHGRKFMKNPLDRLVQWGVVNYVPHLQAEASAIASGRTAGMLGAVGSDARSALMGADTIDARLSTSMDAAKSRAIGGTIAEINAMKADSTLTLSLDPALLLGRYMQSIRSLNAQDFLVTLLRGDVIRPVSATADKAAHVVASELDMVPLFGKPSPRIDYDLLVSSNNADEITEMLRAAGIDSAGLQQKVTEWLVGINKKGAWADQSPFASWLRSVPELQRTANVEDFLMRLKLEQVANNLPLTDPKAMFARVMQSMEDAQDLDQAHRLSETLRKAANAANRAAKARKMEPGNDLDLFIAGEMRRAREQFAWEQVAQDMIQEARRIGTSPQSRINGQDLATFYAPNQETWKLYIPRTVLQSMRDVLEFEKSAPGWLALPKKALDRLNNFWKTRVTVISLAFTSRNALSNTMTNILDLGPLGALNPVTNAKATTISAAIPYVDEYGSLVQARAALGAPKGANETAASYAIRKTRATTFRANRPLQHMIDNGVDLGDGLVREVDEAIVLMRNNGVVSRSFTQFVDIDRFEQDLASIMAASGRGGKTELAKRIASGVEDTLIFAIPSLMGAPGVGLPKKFGASVARLVENQARITNFIGNMRRSGDVTQSAAHANKFLFDYNDLTVTQKQLMRTFFPFFTWTQKNIMLQLEMMREVPYFYAQFNRLMVTGVPRIVDAYEAEDDETFVRKPPIVPDQLKMRQPHTLSRVRIPLPEKWVGFKHAFVEGLGLPQEAFVENIGAFLAAGDIGRIGDFVLGAGQYWDRKPFLRLMSQIHFLGRMMMELQSGHHSFYDRPIAQLTNGRLVAQEVARLKAFPIIGPFVGNMLEEAMDLTVTQEVNFRTGYRESVARVNGGKNWLYGHIPWNRVVRDAAAMSDVFLSSVAYSADELAGQQKPLPYAANLMDAYSGIRTTQDNPVHRDSIYRKRREEATKRMLVAKAAGAREAKHIFLSE